MTSSPLTLQTTIKLRSGYEIPQLGFGVRISPPPLHSTHQNFKLTVAVGIESHRFGRCMCEATLSSTRSNKREYNQPTH